MSSSLLDTRRMETREQFQERWQREARLRARLRLAAFRLEAAQVERVWAVAAAHRQGLSIREIAAVGLSRARVHQLLADPVATELPARLNRLRDEGWPVPAAGELAGPGDDLAPPSQEEDLPRARLADEVTALRACLDWLEQLERGERVMVNLLPRFHDDRDFVAFDRPRVLRVLRRIAGDLDELSHVSGAGSLPPRPESTDPAEHRRRLAEPPPTPARLSAQEERDALRAAAGLDPLP
jgi:hypothetical protein